MANGMSLTVNYVINPTNLMPHGHTYIYIPAKTSFISKVNVTYPEAEIGGSGSANASSGILPPSH